MTSNTRTSKQFKGLGSFAEEILVECPNCHKRAYVKANPKYKVPHPMCYDKPTFSCNNCYKPLSKEVWLGPIYIWSEGGRCAKCGSSLEKKKLVTKYQSKIKEKCNNCNHEQFYKTNHSLTYASDTQATDPYLGLQLWLQLPFDNKILWAYNHEHLEYLKEYIGAKLREATSGGKQALYWNLPQFIKSAKNRESLLKTITKLEMK